MLRHSSEPIILQINGYPVLKFACPLWKRYNVTRTRLIAKKPLGSHAAGLIRRLNQGPPHRPSSAKFCVIIAHCHTKLVFVRTCMVVSAWVIDCESLKQSMTPTFHAKQLFPKENRLTTTRWLAAILRVVWCPGEWKRKYYRKRKYAFHRGK
jgi:hypothetical protein